MHRFSTFVLAAAGLLPLTLSAVTTTPDGKGFPSSDAAAQALVNAAKSNDPAAVLNSWAFGKEHSDHSRCRCRQERPPRLRRSRSPEDESGGEPRQGEYQDGFGRQG